MLGRDNLGRDSHGRLRVTAMSFPSTDLVFAQRVREALAEREDDEVLSAADHLRRRLMSVHPHVDVHPRAALAGFGPDPVLYVFRDGHASHAFEDDWLKSDSVARAVTDADGRYLEVNDAAAVLYGASPDAIVGRPAGSFTRPDARIADAASLWKTLSSTGRLHSLALLRRADGAEVTVEFVTIKDGDGAGRNVTFLREVTDASPDRVSITHDA
jgi:PAS domain S-box-containing protein